MIGETTERTTSSGETITTRETSRRSYFVTLTPSRHNPRRGGMGPAIVDVVTYAHTSDTRPRITPTFRVFVDGVHQWAGPEEHIIGNIDYALRGPFINPVEIVTTPEDFASALTFLVETVTGKMYLWASDADGIPSFLPASVGMDSDPELLALLAEEEEIERIHAANARAQVFRDHRGDARSPEPEYEIDTERER